MCGTKACIKCGTHDSKLWYRGPICRKCYGAARKEHFKRTNHEWYLVNKESVKERGKSYRTTHKEQQREYSRRYQKENHDKLYEYRKQWKIDHRDEINARNRANCLVRYHSDPKFKLSRLLRIRLYHALKKNIRNGSAVRDLGCSLDDFIKYIESQFQPGMTWDNWAHDGWHIDHIIPLDAFDLTDPEQFKKAVHYTNLQPMWARDNFIKHNKVL